MQHRFACSWCNARGGQCDFASLDDLETHIAAQHFNDIHGFYECLYPECWSRFATGRASLKHEFDVHLNDVLHSTPLKKRRNFVEQRLAIHDCLNESINVAVMFLGHGESNASNSESLTTNNDERNKSAKPQISLSLSVVESVAHPTQTQLRFVCSKCGQCDFASLDDLESHIVTQHFNDIHGFYECLYPKCSLHFPTELACLKHELEVHQICENRNFIIQRLKIHECLNESINMTFSGPSRTGQLETAVHQGQVPPLTERRQQHFYDPHAEEKKRASVLLSCLAINPDCLDEAEGARRSKTANSASKLRKSSMDNSELSVKKKRKCEHGNSQDEPSGEITGAVSSSSNRGDCLIPGNTGSVDKNNEMIGPMSASNLFVVKDEQSLFDELAETVPASSSHRQNLILNKSTNHQDSINESIEAVVANHSAKLILGNNDIPGPSNYHHSDKQRATSEGANHQKYSENLSSERAEHGISVVKEEPSLIDELVTMVPGPSNLDDYLMRSNNELPNSKRLRMQNQCNVAHFRKTMNVEQALEYVEELNIDDAIFGADVFLEPPTNEYLSDEDSADEDIGGNMDKFNRNQLLANAELRVQAREGHQDDLFDEVNATPVDVDTSGPVTYPCLHAQLKWSKCGSFADLNAGEIDNAHLVQLTYHTPVQMFELFFSDDLYNMMKVQSELYAISLHKKFTVRIDELKAFIGIMLLSGYMDLPKWRMMLNLVHQLKMRNIGYTGTIQENRLKDCPLDRKRKRNSKNGHERGSYDWSFETSTEILACLWIDNGPVYMLSTVDAVEPIKTVERWSAKEKERLLVTEPNLVRQYNTVMCGVDRMDQNISQPAFDRKSGGFASFHSVLIRVCKMHGKSTGFTIPTSLFWNFDVKLCSIICMATSKHKNGTLSSLNYGVRDKGSARTFDTTVEITGLCSMIPKFFCSKCGLNGFITTNDLEKHIVKRHFYNINALYKCWFANCSELFPTEVTRLQHMHLDPHDINLKTLMQMPDVKFVSCRLEIYSCLNESINLSIRLAIQHAESNGNNLQRPTKGDAGKKSTKPKISARVAQSTEAVVKSVARRSAANKISKPQKPKLDNYGLCGKSNNRNENAQSTSTRLENACVVKVGPSLVNVLVTTNLSNNESAAPSHKPKRSRKQNFSDLNIKSTQTQTTSNPSVIKDEPSFFDELAADIHGPSNYEDDLTPTTSGSSQKQKRSRKQNFTDLCAEANKLSEPTTSSSLPVVKDEPSLIDELAESIPAPTKYEDDLTPSTSDLLSSNPKRSRKQNLYDVDGEDDRNLSLMEEDDLRISVILPKPRKPAKKWKNTTDFVRSAVVKAKSEGISQEKIARILDISQTTVSRQMKKWKTEGTIESKPRPGGPRKCSETIEQFVVKIVKEDPFKTPDDIRSEVLKNFNISISRQTASKILKRSNATQFITTPKAAEI
ncbi:transposase IS4 domain-containing protein [Ditylenchus destructor]|uniref:Transposase IS4 domain-containing protein n=1 Tax=Ditylenchus destructor TaxID=166010 RepID=A0AAD4MPC8_9BILA|nr:transposase IS4 domain-containing protein [Ditylenchus destructor]